MQENSEVITVRYKNYVKVSNQEEKEIDLADIEVDITTSNSTSNQDKQSNGQPNFLALTVLWSYFTACQQGLLSVTETAPWEQIEEVQKDIELQSSKFDYQEWLSFLNQVVDKNWTEWINEPKEIKQRALKAYEQLDNDKIILSGQGEEKKQIKDLTAKVKKQIEDKLTKIKLELSQNDNLL
ncbi:MAG: hypothetical protein ACQERJ_10070 [Bacillota bacterium]